jgi:hypothetical protein
MLSRQASCLLLMLIINMQRVLLWVLVGVCMVSYLLLLLLPPHS